MHQPTLRIKVAFGSPSAWYWGAAASSGSFAAAAGFLASFGGFGPALLVAGGWAVLESRSVFIPRAFERRDGAIQNLVKTDVLRPRGGVVTQRTANPLTPVRFRAWPPTPSGTVTDRRSRLFQPKHWLANVLSAKRPGVEKASAIPR